MEGKLYLCATPIGNLEDITLRVLQTLKDVDLIAAEDTRHSIKLLNHFGIRTPMTSYHEYNKIEKARELVERMREGLQVALVTDGRHAGDLGSRRGTGAAVPGSGHRGNVSAGAGGLHYGADHVGAVPPGASASRPFCLPIKRKSSGFWRN